MENTIESIERFLEATEPLRNALRRLVGSFPESTKLPDADSQAMREIAQEGAWQLEGDETWGNPVSATHSMAGFQYQLSMEYATAMNSLVESSEPPFVHAPGALVRPSLEAAARSYWLSEAGIGTRERLRRGVNDRLEGLYWNREYGPPVSREFVAQRMARILEVAQGFEFQVLPRSKSRQRFLAPGRPSGRKVVAHLFGALNIDSSVPDVLNLYGSAFVHGAPLAQTMFAEPVNNPLGGGETSQIRLTNHDANLMLRVAIIALVVAGRMRFIFNGWDEANWSDKANHALKLSAEAHQDHPSTS